MQRAKKIGKPILQIGLPLIILAIIIIYIRRDWNQLTSYTFEWNPALLALAFGGFLLQELSYGLIWRSVLARLGSKLDLRISLRIYLASEFVRYIPGNVWHVLTRVLWVSKYGVPRPIAFASMMVELITKLAAGVFVFAVSLLFWGNLGSVRSLLYGTPIVVALGVLTILALLIVLHPRILSTLLNTALRLLKRNPVVLSLRYSDILFVTLAWCASWLIAGAAFYVLLLALWPHAPLIALPICIGIYAIAWDVGFVSFITPSGLGFREGAITGLFLLALPLPGALAAIIAVLSRLVSTLAELVCVSIAYLSGGGQARAIQHEQEAISQFHEQDHAGKEDAALLSTDAPEHLNVEEGVIGD
ncbi:MAG: flippase-like domain-containing protein [Ktedonobacteraceae bacterium]|nr:flippase-like domain-containing protein [Ktedonobacteraceae bacterium]